MRLVSVVIASSLFVSLAEAGVTFQITYSDPAGTGFNDFTYGAQRKAALQFAANTWGNAMGSSYVGETITVTAAYVSQGGSAYSAPLAQAGPQFTGYGSDYKGLQGNVWYPVALANHIAKSRISTSTAIQVQVNSDIGTPSVLGGNSFYFGTDGQGPANSYDFVSIALHELGHGLGFVSAIEQDGSYLSGQYSIFDTHLARDFGGSTQLLLTMTQAQRQTALTSGQLVWTGSQGVAANGGQLVQMYAPNPYEPGSSTSHLDLATFSTALMSPQYSDVIRQPDLVSAGVLNDIGWSIAVPEPGIVFTLLGGSAILMLRKRERKAA